jgi:hypothetical protein
MKVRTVWYDQIQGELKFLVILFVIFNLPFLKILISKGDWAMQKMLHWSRATSFEW